MTDTDNIKIGHFTVSQKKQASNKGHADYILSNIINDIAGYSFPWRELPIVKDWEAMFPEWIMAVKPVSKNGNLVINLEFTQREDSRIELSDNEDLASLWNEWEKIGELGDYDKPQTRLIRRLTVYGQPYTNINRVTFNQSYTREGFPTAHCSVKITTEEYKRVSCDL